MANVVVEAAEAVVNVIDEKIQFNHSMLLLVDDMLKEPLRFVSDLSMETRRFELAAERSELLLKRAIAVQFLEVKRREGFAS